MSVIGNSPGVASQRVVSPFTATSGQTTFTPISGYTLGYCDVFLNGIKLANGDDYTAADGTTVVLAVGAALGDFVEVVAYFPRGLSDGYLKAEADARFPRVDTALQGLNSTQQGNARTNINAVNKAGDTITGGLLLQNDLSLGRTDASNSIVLSSASQAAGREVIFQAAGGGAISTAWRFRGRVLRQDTPAFLATYNVGSPTTYTAGGRILNFPSVSYNVGGHYDETNKFTAPVAGKYLFIVDRALNTVGNGKTIRHPSMSFKKNNGAVYSVNTAVSTGTDLGESEYTHFNVNMTAILDMAANEYVQVWFSYDNQPATLQEYATSSFQGYFLG